MNLFTYRSGPSNPSASLPPFIPLEFWPQLRAVRGRNLRKT
jgi:hypothetical protein